MTQITPHPGIGEAGERYIVVSIDGHDGPPSHPEKFREYFEAKHLPTFEEGVKSAAEADKAVMARETSKDPGIRYDADPYRDWFAAILIDSFGMDVETALESVRLYRPSEPAATDPVAHMALTEAAGVVGEFIHPGEHNFRAFARSHPDRDFARAAELAHMRWLADYCNAVPGRIAGVNPTTITHIDQLDTAINDIRWGRDNGLFGGVRLPAPSPQNKDLPPLVDPAWDKLWAVCAELRTPLIAHQGSHRPPDGQFAYGDDHDIAHGLNLLELGIFSKRTFWHLIASGAFDRHPDLKFGLIEHQIGALAGILHEFDQVFLSSAGARIRRRHKMIPSEYWYNHGFIGSPFLDAVDARKHRHEIGLETLMWGGDFPHPEGSFPYYKSSMRHSLGGLPEHEIRAILAGNALRIFDYDLVKLRAAADRVGPTVEELSTPLPTADIPPHATAWAFAPYRMRTLEGV